MENILGIPGQGFHTHFMGIAWRDVVGTIVLGALLAYFNHWNVVKTIFVAFLLGIILHRLFNVRTTIDKFLFR